MLKKIQLALASILVASSLVAVPLAAPAVVFAETTNTTSTSSIASQKLKKSWPWYIIRAAGLVAAVSLVLLMLSGMGLLTGHTYKFLEPLTAWATHRALGIAFGISVILHIVPLLFEHYAPFNIAEILFPFVSDLKEVSWGSLRLGSLWVALGIFAMYMVAAVVISSLLWIDKKPHTWKLIHFISYLIMIFVFFHALYLGTDLASGVFKFLWIVFGVTVAAYTVLRLMRAGTMKS